MQYTTREKLSVFTFTAASDEQRTVWLPRMQQSVLRARTLRHPALLRYHGATIEGPNANTLVIVTERVLVSFADATPATLDPQEALLGLLNVVKALDFLHTTCQILHNNICAPSVFIVQDGSWRLGGFEFCLPMSDLGTAAFEGLDGAVDDVAPKAADAEEAEESVVIPHVRDVQALGRLAARIIASTSETDDSSVLSQLSGTLSSLKKKKRLTLVFRVGGGDTAVGQCAHPCATARARYLCQQPVSPDRPVAQQLYPFGRPRKAAVFLVRRRMGFVI